MSEYQAVIQGTQLVHPPNGKKYTEYIIEVTRDGSTWKVGRRYNDFLHLYNKMKSRYNNIPRKFPNKKFTATATFSPKVTDKRHIKLQTWLSRVLMQFSQSNLVEQFLEEGKRDLQLVELAFEQGKVRSDLEYLGYLHKLHVSGKVWKQRWFVLRHNILYKYHTHTDKYPFGMYDLRGAMVSVLEDSEVQESTPANPFMVRVPGDSPIFFCAESERERNAWLAAISGHVENDSPSQSSDSEVANKLFGVALEDVTHQDAYGRPLFLTALLEFLGTTTLPEEETAKLFTLAPDQQLRRALDRGETDFDWVSDPNAVAGLVLIFLHELPEPLIPMDLRDCFLGVAAIKNQTIQTDMLSTLVMCLPENHIELFRTLLSFIYDICTRGSSIDEMSEIFGRLFFRPPTVYTDEDVIAYEKHAIIETTKRMIQLYDKILPQQVSVEDMYLEREEVPEDAPAPIQAIELDPESKRRKHKKKKKKKQSTSHKSSTKKTPRSLNSGEASLSTPSLTIDLVSVSKKSGSSKKSPRSKSPRKSPRKSSSSSSSSSSSGSKSPRRSSSSKRIDSAHSLLQGTTSSSTSTTDATPSSPDPVQGSSPSMAQRPRFSPATCDEGGGQPSADAESDLSADSLAAKETLRSVPVRTADLLSEQTALKQQQALAEQQDMAEQKPDRTVQQQDMVEQKTDRTEQQPDDSQPDALDQPPVRAPPTPAAADEEAEQPPARPPPSPEHQAAAFLDQSAVAESTEKTEQRCATLDRDEAPPARAPPTPAEPLLEQKAEQKMPTEPAQEAEQPPPARPPPTPAPEHCAAKEVATSAADEEPPARSAPVPVVSVDEKAVAGDELPPTRTPPAPGPVAAVEPTNRTVAEAGLAGTQAEQSEQTAETLVTKEEAIKEEAIKEEAIKEEAVQADEEEKEEKPPARAPPTPTAAAEVNVHAEEATKADVGDVEEKPPARPPPAPTAVSQSSQPADDHSDELEPEKSRCASPTPPVAPVDDAAANQSAEVSVEDTLEEGTHEEADSPPIRSAPTLTVEPATTSNSATTVSPSPADNETPQSPATQEEESSAANLPSLLDTLSRPNTRRLHHTSIRRPKHTGRRPPSRRAIPSVMIVDAPTNQPRSYKNEQPNANATVNPLLTPTNKLMMEMKMILGQRGGPPMGLRPPGGGR
eukprot:CAMPEP_0174246496 /NCGR_PEP_ID=MMETSP0417-20130205/42099_1 /TAXON_ID=242541 /ORGANISM="Mayorella sp, Strain BSH-02190019" /LENGTH=1161 /DNA_ID=CAMNT_0015326349 /DNA_START=121 /DNA_END=3603 /DNA_ORIENTATION=-